MIVTSRSELFQHGTGLVEIERENDRRRGSSWQMCIAWQPVDEHFLQLLTSMWNSQHRWSRLRSLDRNWNWCASHTRTSIIQLLSAVHQFSRSVVLNERSQLHLVVQAWDKYSPRIHDIHSIYLHKTVLTNCALCYKSQSSPRFYSTEQSAQRTLHRKFLIRNIDDHGHIRSFGRCEAIEPRETQQVVQIRMLLCGWICAANES